MFSLIVILLIAAVVLIKSLVNAEYLAEELEESINSKVEIGDVELALFSSPTRITLSDVKLSPRDGGDTLASIEVDQLELNVSFWQLFNKHIDISQITIKRAIITSMYFEDGSTSLGEMLRSPEEQGRQGGGGVSSDADEDEEGGFNIFDQEDFMASLGSLIIEDSLVDITLEKTGLRVRCNDVQLELSSIKIDPKNLRVTNTAQLTLSSMVKIHSTQGRHYGDLDLTGNATARIFNPLTGNTEPDVEGSFDLHSGSWLNTQVPVITSTWASLKKIGISIAPLPERATFGRSQAITAHYHLGKVAVREPLSIWVGDWELAALDGSWLQTETDQHQFNAELLVSANASASVLRGMTSVIKFLPEKVADTMMKEVNEELFRDGRLVVKVESSGDFSDPKIRVVDGVSDLLEKAKGSSKEALKEKAGGILRGLLE